MRLTDGCPAGPAVVNRLSGVRWKRQLRGRLLELRWLADAHGRVCTARGVVGSRLQAQVPERLRSSRLRAQTAQTRRPEGPAPNRPGIPDHVGGRGNPA